MALDINILIILLAVGFVIGFMVGAILRMFMVLSKVPGKLIWLKGNVTPIMNIQSDGGAEVIEGKKQARSGLIFNLGSNNEVVDPAVTPEIKPVLRLNGRKVLLRWKNSALTNTIDEAGSIDTILRHVTDNTDLYPRLSRLLGPKDFWIMGALSHDSVTEAELLQRYCIPKKGKVDDKGAPIIDEKTKKQAEYTAEEIDKLKQNELAEWMKEVELLRHNVKFVPRKEIYVDFARAIAATMVPINAFILKSYRREIEASVKNKQQGWDLGTLATGALLGLVMGLILAKVLGL
jgi:hypothetical protein